MDPLIMERRRETMGGAAVADVLFGDANPGGKLPITFPRSVGQIPLYYNHKSTGRPLEPDNRYTSKYLDVPNTPLYPFGFGLSYTTFKLSNLQLSSGKISKTGEVRISVDLENVGKRDGAEVVQLYVHDLAASITRPVNELKGFQRISLRPGEKRKVEITLNAKDLGFYNVMNQYVVEAGKFDVMVGTSSESGLRDSFLIIEK